MIDLIENMIDQTENMTDLIENVIDHESYDVDLLPESIHGTVSDWPQLLGCCPDFFTMHEKPIIILVNAKCNYVNTFRMLVKMRTNLPLFSLLTIKYLLFLSN